MRKFDKDGWPKDGLIVPDVEEFLHGQWVKPGASAIEMIGYDPDEDPRHSIEEGLAIAKAASEVAGNYHCGTQCCLVGWMGAAFGGATEPGLARYLPLSKAHREFATQVLAAAGSDKDPSDYYDYKLLEACSNAFEGLNYDDESGMSGEQARKIWIRAGEACGYDLSAFKERKRRA